MSRHIKINVMEEYTWEDMYDLLHDYYTQYKSMPSLHYVHTPSQVKLGMWLENQRQAFKNEQLAEEQIDLLENINFMQGVPNKHIYTWEYKFFLLKEYYTNYNELPAYDYVHEPSQVGYVARKSKRGIFT